MPEAVGGISEKAALLPRDADLAISVEQLGKCYRIYDNPRDRLKQAFFRNSRYFREFWALRNVSFEVRRGETVGIIGRNGCGKSTLLQLIAGTLTPTHGKVHVNGRLAALLELGTGFNPEFTGHDNIFTNAAILGLSQAEIRDRYEDIVRFSELGSFINQPVKTYSSGMYLRLAFAVAITVEPDILVVDEALAVGDEAFQRKCFGRITAIQKRGGTVLFVSHSSNTVVDLCSRAVLLEQGELLTSGRPKMVIAKYHKLLYSPPDKTAQVRKSIEDSGEEPLPKTDKAAASQPETSAAYLDGNMQSRSAVSYTSNGAVIEEAKITTPRGTPVNVLVPHEEYAVQYRVTFTQPAFHVCCGTLIKTIVGTELGGMNTGDRIDYIPAGTEAKLSFRFRCQMVPGVYFANVGLMGIVDGRDTYLHRIEDALMFRVQHGGNGSLVGPMDFFVDWQLDSKNAEKVKEAA